MSDPRPVSPIIFAAESKLTSAQPGFHRIKVGSVDVIALSDGSFRLYMRDQMRNLSAEEVEKVIVRSHLKSPTHHSVNSFLIALGDRLLMIDVGGGEVFGPKLNKLSKSLGGIGLRPEDVTDILLTHIHPDHSGGLVVGGRKVYPNAKVHVNKEELDYWTSEDNASHATGHTADWFKVFEATVRPYLNDGDVEAYDGEVELFPHIRTVRQYGHTPGQMAYILEDEGEKIAFWGDLVHLPEVQFEVPTVSIVFDIDQEQAAAQRLSSFSDAAERGYLVAMPHAHFPGVGHVQRVSGDEFRWVPLPYVNDAIES
jgi:glyoxylase-like metal-dependent hydrolase (beta-lactamase superfamily II)